MQGHDKAVARLLTGGTDAARVTIDGKNALDVSASPECRFLLRMLVSAEDEETQVCARKENAWPPHAGRQLCREAFQSPGEAVRWRTHPDERGLAQYGSLLTHY